MAKNDKSYVANWLISGHKGKDFQPGEEVSLPDDEAAPFLACGALRLKSDAAEAEAEAGEEASAAAADGAGESAPASDTQ